MVKKYDAIVVGFGKAGKTIAGQMADEGWSAALVERDETMYGGLCINRACIPTKTLIQAGKDGKDFGQAYDLRDTVTSRLRQNNFDKLDAVVDVYTAEARFLDNKEIELRASDEREVLKADTIIINTGSKPVVPDIKGLKDSEKVYNSTTLQELRQQPDHLGIIGGGNVGLEFAVMYAQLGSNVTILNHSDTILQEEESEIAELVTEYLEEDGIRIINNAETESIEDKNESVIAHTSQGDYKFDALLYATGRKPDTMDLGLENTDIELGENDEIEVDEYLRSSVEGVFAAGDVNGGPQFTYISADDSRILYDYLFGEQEYSLKKRKNVPYAHFLNPPLARVGLTEKEALEQNINYKTNTMKVASMPRANVDDKRRGLFKVVIDSDSELIRGASLLGEESPEVINLIKIAMDHDIPYTYFQSQIFTHPTISENFNGLFDI